jgi:hypothetical protein
MSMRHWLAGVLARERPALFRALPESFKVGHPLPQKAESRSQNSESRNMHKRVSPEWPVYVYVYD